MVRSLPVSVTFCIGSGRLLLYHIGSRSLGCPCQAADASQGRWLWLRNRDLSWHERYCATPCENSHGDLYREILECPPLDRTTQCIRGKGRWYYVIRGRWLHLIAVFFFFFIIVRTDIFVFFITTLTTITLICHAFKSDPTTQSEYGRFAFGDSEVDTSHDVKDTRAGGTHHEM